VSPRWLAGKVLTAFLTLIFVLIVNFFLFRVMGDPTSQLARLPQASPEEIQQLRAYYGLDKPILGQFADYVSDTVQGDLGISQKTRRTVWTEIKEALPWTLLLVGTGTLLATVIGTWLGIVAATRRGSRTDDGLLGFSLFSYAAPEYWIGIILILLFAVAVPLFPAGLQETPGADYTGLERVLDIGEHLVLPATAMTLMLLGQYFVIMRSSMVDVLTEDFITVKRATGLPWARVVRGHAVPNALLPLVTLSAIQFGLVMGGAITVETIFSWPGLGLYAVTAVENQDYPAIMAFTLVSTVAYVLINMVVDVLYPLFNVQTRR
jgi:peptide/nickel transport system permease protein